ncbi:hypothetical protein MOF32_28910 [Priestia megaterium]|uniref:hypothetical protein n=1 Tax=Priestia megaterium TaxID=1404 RepID=UPI00227DF92D|nr:hypothetical protein [Priestia megaterium]MCY9017498.1 hypothetical protein [Priestia megaterium]MCY9026898.1 hypothetical protein [Priestia megaterium]
MSSCKKRKVCCPTSCSSPESPPKSCPAYGNFFNNTSLVTVLTGTAFPHLPTVGLFLNNVQIPLEQANFGLEITQAEGRGCKPIVGDTILSIPDNSILELRNITTQGPVTTIITCDSVGNNVQLSLFKLS